MNSNKHFITRLRCGAAIMCASLAMLLPISACAAPKKMPDGQMFDAEYYAATYPDVVQALGTDEETLYQHYQMFGKKEGRNPYSPDVKTAQDELIGQKILAFQSVYPEGMAWTNDIGYRNPIAAPNIAFYGCAAFAMQISDAVYGVSTPIEKLKAKTCAELQPGDIVRIFNDTHSIVVISVDDKYVTACEGNYNGTVHWNDKYPRNMLDGDIAYVWRRATGQQVVSPTQKTTGQQTAQTK